MDSSISKNKSDAIKVIAVIFMIMHHLFAFPDRIKGVQYISVYKVNQTISLEYFIAEFCLICVPIFLFLSGYGLYKKYSYIVTYKEIKNRILKLLINYWIILFIFYFIGLILGKYTLNIKEFIMNFLTISSSYNREWWFLNTYIILIILYPVILILINRFIFNICIIISLILTILSRLLMKFMAIMAIESIILTLLNNMLSNQFIFVFGILVAKYALFDKISRKITLNRFSYYFIILIIVLINMNLSLIGSIFRLLSPIIFIYSIVKLIPDLSFLNRFSKHTTNIWLTHSFFCYYLFQRLTFAPKLSVLIILWNIILSLISSVIINYILNKLFNKKVKFNICR